MHLEDRYRSRAMALEAGTAAHEVFAAHRLWHLKHNKAILPLRLSRAPSVWQITLRTDGSSRL